LVHRSLTRKMTETCYLNDSIGLIRDRDGLLSTLLSLLYDDSAESVAGLDESNRDGRTLLKISKELKKLQNALIIKRALV
jgi:hypothetical protein